MTNSVPRSAETLLKALGSDSEFCNEVLGDLAEEHDERVLWDGTSAARRWYYRESLRVAPYLLRDWRRRLRLRDAGEFAGAVLWSTVTAAALDAVFKAVMYRTVFRVTGIPLNAYIRHWEIVGDPLLPALVTFWMLFISIPAGAVAASLGRRAPLMSAFTASVVWACWMIPLALRSPHPGLLTANVGTMLLAMMAGATLQTLRAGRRAATITLA